MDKKDRNLAFIISRKGKRVREEIIYNSTKIIKIQLIKFEDRLFWIKRVNGLIKDFVEVTP